MRFEIWKEKQKHEPEQIVRLRMVGGSFGFTIMAVNEEGERVSQGDLLHIGKDGVLLHCDVDEGIGFKLDDEGRLAVRGKDLLAVQLEG